MRWRRFLSGRASDSERQFRLDLGESLAEVGRDLLAIEINTAVKACMTARKMPELPHALLDIAGDYCRWLSERGIVHGIDERRVAEPTFRRLCETAKARVEDPSFSAEEQLVLTRIHETSAELVETIRWLRERRPEWQPFVGSREGGPGATRDEVRTLLRRGGRLSPGAPAAEVGFIRKAWDVGTETVLVQTMVQLDGDVLTRVAEPVLREERQGLLAIHRDGVEYSLKYWQGLFAVLVGLFGLARRGSSAGESGEG
jgi:hypothetical protein